MRTFTYWVAPCESDSPAYSEIGRTKKEVLAKLKDVEGDYGPPEKRVIHYEDLFDFFEQLTGEGGSRLWGKQVGTP
jgi:hypothetical protein